ncbi:MAG TPA: glycosyltransferase [Myxococcaceae bacterium]|nr:glycosyltransferase [Myxococcaceae bacterium]
MVRPFVSVLLPVRDAARTLEAAARSMLHQTYPRLEVWIVDDGSTDGSGEVAEALAREDGRVRVVRTGGKGLVAALELGRARCAGELVARMDADDESLPERLERSVAALEADRSLWAVGTQVEIFRDDQPVSPNMQAYARWLNGLTDPERLAAERFVDAPLCHPSALIRREALEAVGGWKDGAHAEDFQLWLELLARGGRLRAVEPVLFRWRDSGGRLTRVDPRYSWRRMVELKAEYAARLAPRARVWGATEVGLQMMRALRGRGTEVDALVDVDPRKVGQRIDGVVVSGPDALPPPEPGCCLFAAVGAKGARQEIRAFVLARGYREGADFFAVA